MAEALVRGILHANLMPAGHVVASDPDEARRGLFAEMGVEVSAENADPAECPALLLAVKPQSLDQVLAGVRGVVRPDALVVSIAAGVRTKRIAEDLNGEVRIVRVMPNTPMLVGRGVSCAALGPGAKAQDMDVVLRMLRCAGKAYEVTEEMLDAVTAVSGTGPAYLFRFVESLVLAAEDAGLPQELCKNLVLETMIGAAHLLEESGRSPGELRKQVTSPGGTTAAAMTFLGDKGFDDLVTGAVAAALKRSLELGEQV